MIGGSGAVRAPAVAGQFYPASPATVTRRLDAILGDVPTTVGHDRPVGIVAPHAGWTFSGSVAAAVFGRVARTGWDRVVVIGPSHLVPVDGVAVPTARAFATPLGDLPVDVEARDRLRDRPGVVVDDAAHAHEHSVEVELPFVQHLFGDVPVVPLVVGRAPPGLVADVLAEVVGPGALLVVSTDLSHHLPEPVARERDERTADAITDRRHEDIGPDDACGQAPLRGALELARRRHLDVTRVAMATSADAGADPGSVVGYGAFTMG